MNREYLTQLPTIFYVALLFIVWFVLWLMDIILLLNGKTDASVFISIDSVRWFVRSSVDSISSMPWGIIFLWLILAGVISASGIPSASFRFLRGTATIKSRRAFSLSFVALILICVCWLLGALYPLNLFGNISGTLTDSPFARGWLFLLFVSVSFVSVVFGIVYGRYKTINDVLEGMCSYIRFHAPSLLSLVPAALLISTMDYAGITVKLFPSFSYFLECVIILFPFLYRYLFKS